MFKRILTFALAGILVMETPAAAYAAEPGAGITTAEGSERVTAGDETGTGGTADNNTGNDNTENRDTENDNMENDGVGDGDVENGNAENNDPENVDPEGSGSGNHDTADGDSENSGSGNNGTENVDPEDSDIGNNGTEDSNTENGDTDNDSTENDGPEDSDHENDNTENDGTENESSVSENDVAISGNDSSVSENTLYAVSEDNAVPTDGSVTEISYEEAKGSGVTIHAPAGQAQAAWYSFTAPRAGRYAFYTEEADRENKGMVYVNLCAEKDTNTKNHTTCFDSGLPPSVYARLWISTDYMEQGETVYLETYTTESEDKTYTMKAADQQEIEAEEDGSKSLLLENGDRVTIKSTGGCDKLRFEAEVTYAGSSETVYYIHPFWCPADHSTGDLNANAYKFDINNTIVLQRYRSLSGQVVAENLEGNTAYEASYALLRCPKEAGDLRKMEFVALIPGTECVTKDRGEEEWVYVHDVACENHAITIDVEPVRLKGAGNKDIYCYYAPADGSEEEKAVEIDQWKRYEFTGLKAGTEFRFELRTNTWSEPLKTITAQTTGTLLEVNVSDYSAVISEDFTTITISAKTNYTGDASTVLCGSYRDEGNSYTFYEKARKTEEAGGQGVILSSTDKYWAERMFLPDKTYEMTIWTEIRDECIITEPQVIEIHTPEQACYNEEELVINVTQDSDVNTAVNCEIQMPKHAGWDGLIRGYVFYKPIGRDKYEGKSVKLSEYEETTADGTKKRLRGNIQITDLQAGAEYEFVLSFGGSVKRCTLDLNESGIRLVRTQDAADYVGPYDFMQMYMLSDTKGELSGDYYVQLQTVRLDSTDYYNNYVNDGSVISLNEVDGYKMTYSSAEHLKRWFVPNARYGLRWLVGREKNVTKDNAIFCLYENLTMGSSSPLKIEKTGYMQYQLTMDEKDVAALKANGLNKYLTCHFRKEGTSTYVANGGSMSFGASNNFSHILYNVDFAHNTSYEMYLGIGGDKYAEGVFNTDDSQEKLQVDSVDATVNTVSVKYSVQNVDLTAAPFVILYVRKAGGTVWSKNYYRAKESGEVGLYRLQPDTEYEYRIGFGAAGSTPVNELQSRQDGKFTTKAETKKISVLSVRPRAESVDINCSASGVAEAGENDIFKYVVFYYRPVTAGTEKPDWRYGTSIVIKDKIRVEGRIKDLTQETTYEYRAGYARVSNTHADELICTVEGTFTTTPDLRGTEVTVTPGMYTAQVDCNYNNVEDSAYLHLYVREDTAEADWQQTEARRVWESGNGSVETFMLEGLKEHTGYQYKAGFGKQADTEPDALAKVSEGTFTTWQDTRGVSVTARARVTSADIACTLIGMEHADKGYLCGFLRETAVTEDPAEDSGSGVVLWNRQFAEPVDSRSTGGRVQIRELQADTEYELLIGFGDGQESEADRLLHTQTITFRTLEDQRKLSEAKAEVKKTSVVLSALLTGNTEPLSSYVSFFYRIKGEKEYRRAGYITNASSMETAACSVTLTGLEKEMTYEYAAVLSNTRAEVTDPDSVIRTGWKAAGEFITLSPETPDSVTLSQEKLCLNASEIYKNQRGYGYEDLKITWSPENITKDFLWESSDPEVAAVSKDGRVSAVAPGTAQITVTSKYNPEAADTCQIVVGKYQIGHVDGEGNVGLVDATAFNVVKGQCYSGYGLYDLVSGTPAAVTEAKVTSDNEAAVSWYAGEITAGQTGLAHLVFEAPDGVRAVMAIDVQTVPGRGFDIVGFEAGFSKYPAVREEEKDKDRVQYTLACKSGITYTAIGEIMPESVPFVNSDFTWSIDNTDVAEVNEAGVITPKAAGKAVLLVTPKETAQEGGAPYLKQTCEVTLLVKELPSEQLVDATPVYALANISKKIGDVQMPKEEAWEGWRWEEPNTPLVINGVNKDSYPFRAVYTGEEYYPEEKTIKVYIARVTGVSVTENAGDGPGHYKVIETSTLDEEGNPVQTSDRLTLTVESKGYGAVNYAEETNYFYDMDIIAPARVIVQKGEMHTVNGMPCRNVAIAAVKPGTYTVTAVIKVKDRNNSNEKTLAKAAYKVKAVAGKQAYVTLLPETTGSVVLEDGRVIIDSTADTKTFRVQAALTDRNGQEQEAFDRVKLAWSTTDRKVITVKPSADTHSAEITVKGEGHAILKAKVKDTAGHDAELRVEIRNNAPRVSTEKAIVNLAYDYDTEAGRELAQASSGMVEIVPVYGELIKNVILYNEDKETVCSDLALISVTADKVWRVLIRDSKASGTGVYNCWLCVGTNTQDYFYPLQVTVKDEQEKMTVKSSRAANLFYRSEPAAVDITVPKSGAQIASVTWEADAADPDHGFSAEPIEYTKNDTFRKAANAARYYFKQGDIQLTDKNKPADTGVLSGTVRVKLEGYKAPGEGVRISLKWNYKKPVIVTDQASVTLLPAMEDKNTGRFDLYNKTEKKRLSYSGDSQNAANPKYVYSELSCDNENITFLPDSDTLGWRRYRYTGSKTKGSEKLNLTLRNSDWREPLSAVHTVKLALPTAYFSQKQLTVNTKQIGTAYTELRLKNAYDAVLFCDTVIVEGGNQKAKALLEKDLLEIRQDSSRKDRIMVKINRAETMEQQPVANGTYPYKITPCYTDAGGNTVKMKPLTLKVKVVNKMITAKVKTLGKLDLTKEAGNNSSNYISIKTTFQNIGSNYTLKDYGNIRLLGEYTDYFDLRLLTGRPGEYRLRIKQAGKLKAGQHYKLAIRFTVEMEDGDIFTVQSQTFTVTPKQSAPKIKVYDNNQTLYAAADALQRTYELEVPAEGGYQIMYVSGGIDCNKDGKQDIVVKHNKSFASRVGITVSITDRDSVLTVTGKRGKTYTIPVTVKLMGRDGIAKDVKTSIKVTVKR